MANFVLLYSGGSGGTNPAEREKIMQQWGAWFGKLGDRIVDAGNPFAEHAKSLSNGSVHDGAVGTPATGYLPNPACHLTDQGANPDAPLLQAQDGTLMGVTADGGTTTNGDTPAGTVFAIDLR